MFQLPTEDFLPLLSSFGISPGDGQLGAFAAYGEFLLEYNGKVNLTAITDPAQIAVKHFADSVIPLSLIGLPQGCSLIDVGTGAGFPGVPMKIMRPDLSLTLLDSLQKRLTFLEQLSDRLGPVSYTHLDVYKRQTLFYRTLLCPFPALFAEMVDAQCGLCLWAARKTARWWEKGR